MQVKTLMDTVVDTLVFVGLALVYIAEAIVQLFVPVRYKSKSVKGDIVLITGGGGGLGRLLAERFAKLGSTIVVWDINKQAIDDTVELVKSQGGKAFGYVCDITNREQVYKIAKEVRNEAGMVSILINNAGMVSGKSLLETPDHLIQRTFDVNIVSHFWTTKAFLPDMIDAKKGHVVTIASMAGIVGVTKLVDYCASKFAAVGFNESLSLELQSHGHNSIHTTAICPYFIRSTGMFEGVHTRLIPILEATEVADRVVRAVLCNEKKVFLPGFFKAMVVLKGLMPWSVESMFLRTLVQDAHPDRPVNKETGDRLEFTKKPQSLRETATASLQNTYRNISSSERKP